MRFLVSFLLLLVFQTSLIAETEIITDKEFKFFNHVFTENNLSDPLEPPYYSYTNGLYDGSFQNIQYNYINAQNQYILGKITTRVNFRYFLKAATKPASTDVQFTVYQYLKNQLVYQAQCWGNADLYELQWKSDQQTPYTIESIDSKFDVRCDVKLNVPEKEAYYIAKSTPFPLHIYNEVIAGFLRWNVKPELTCEEYKAQYEQLSSAFDVLTKNYSTLKSDYSFLKSEYDQIAESYNNVSEENRSLRLEIRSLDYLFRTTVADLKAELNKCREESINSSLIASLRDQLAELNASYKSLLEKYNSISERLIQERENSSTMTASYGSLLDQNRSYAQENLALENRVSILSKRNKRLKRILRELRRN